MFYSMKIIIMVMYIANAIMAFKYTLCTEILSSRQLALGPDVRSYKCFFSCLLIYI